MVEKYHILRKILYGTDDRGPGAEISRKTPRYNGLVGLSLRLTAGVFFPYNLSIQPYGQILNGHPPAPVAHFSERRFCHVGDCGHCFTGCASAKNGE
jgi:hypothetical protein